MIFMGIDPSLTGTGIAILDSGLENKSYLAEHYLIKTKSSDEIEARYDQIMKKISSLTDGKDIQYIYIEGLSFGSKGAAVTELAGLHYIIRYYLYKMGISFKEIPPTTLKKYITGSGKAQKNLMLLNIYKKWGIEFTDDNTADAYSLARYALEENTTYDNT